jgi:hypothetical protein
MKIRFSPFVRNDRFDVDPAEFVEAINTSVIRGSRLLWLQEAGML